MFAASLHFFSLIRRYMLHLLEIKQGFLFACLFFLVGRYLREVARGIILALGVLPAFSYILTPPHFSCNVAESG